MEYYIYDTFWTIETLITIAIKYYILIAAYRFVRSRRWPKWKV